MNETPHAVSCDFATRHSLACAFFGKWTKCQLLCHVGNCSMALMPHQVASMRCCMAGCGDVCCQQDMLAVYYVGKTISKFWGAGNLGGSYVLLPSRPRAITISLNLSAVENMQYWVLIFGRCLKCLNGTIGFILGFSHSSLRSKASRIELQHSAHWRGCCKAQRSEVWGTGFPSLTKFAFSGVVLLLDSATIVKMWSCSVLRKENVLVADARSCGCDRTKSCKASEDRRR